MCQPMDLTEPGTMRQRLPIWMQQLYYHVRSQEMGIYPAVDPLESTSKNSRSKSQLEKNITK